jgi:threonyl-tRNA synthetase
VMVHRACYGSLERFFGIITEHFAGAFPLWLAPEQVRVLPLSEKYNDYAHEVAGQLRGQGLRAHVDLSDERLGYKIRNGAMMKVPYLLVVGAKEAESGTINVRTREGADLGATTVGAFLDSLDPWTVPRLIERLARGRDQQSAA